MFITLEGVDGSGKSLQAGLISDALRTLGHRICQTREPGGTQGAEALRDLVLNGETDRWSPMSEALIFTAARRDHCERVIWPAIARGDIVLCDRFYDSTRLYQGLASEEMNKTVKTLHKTAIHTMPDLTLIFDIDPERAFARMGERDGQDMRFEGNGLEFQKKRRAGFQEIAQNEPERCVLVDASRPVEEVTKSCLDVIVKRINNG